jgi:hypothetical protein
MTDMYRPAPQPRQPVLNSGRLWAGGAATAVVAALIAIAGILIGRGIFDVEVLAPKGDGVWGDASTGWYALGAAFAALIATGLLHLLILTTPKPFRFFGWVVALATVVAMLLPFTTEEDKGSRYYTVGLVFILGVAIGSLVSGVGRSALRPVVLAPNVRPTPPQYR